MAKIKRYRNKIEEFLSGEKGQRFFNFAYSIGAAVVIWGALFKILHLPGGNLLLAIGMGTEVLMFILMAFDRPYSAHREPIADSYSSNERHILPVYDEVTVSSDGSKVRPSSEIQLPAQRISLPNVEMNDYTQEVEEVIKEMKKLRETTSALNTLYEMQLKSVSAQLSAFEQSGGNVATMREMMEKSAQQSQKYCEETERMAQNMNTLNSIYAAMITAMSGNNSVKP